MSSLLAQALNSFKSAAVAAHASALAPGQPAGGQGLEDFLGMAAAEQKRNLCGSLVDGPLRPYLFGMTGVDPGVGSCRAQHATEP